MPTEVRNTNIICFGEANKNIVGEKNEMKWLFHKIMILKKNKKNKISDNWKLGLPQLWVIPTGKTPWRLCLMHLSGLGKPLRSSADGRRYRYQSPREFRRLNPRARPGIWKFINVYERIGGRL